MLPLAKWPIGGTDNKITLSSLSSFVAQVPREAVQRILEAVQRILYVPYLLDGKSGLAWRRFLEKRYNDDIELEDAIHTAILTPR